MIEFKLNSLEFSGKKVTGVFCFYADEVYELEIESDPDISIVELKKLAIKGFKLNVNAYAEYDEKHFSFKREE